MRQTLVLVHTVAPLVADFDRRCHALLPDVRVLHVLDEPILDRIERRGLRTEEDDHWLAAQVASAEASGAAAVLITCSTLSQSAAAVRSAAAIPLVTIDEAMASLAVRSGPRIALIATNASTLEPSRVLLLDEAERAGRQIEIRSRLVAGALDELRAGRVANHDELVDRAIREEAVDADVVVLAQATMARVLDAMTGPPFPVAVLSSPDLALAKVRDILFGSEVRR
jgi:aspartate/glutamate racemase